MFGLPDADDTDYPREHHYLTATSSTLLTEARPFPSLLLFVFACAPPPRPPTDSPDFASAAALPSSHTAALRAATGIAVAGLKVIVDEAFRKQIRKEWEEDITSANAGEAVKTIADTLPMSGEKVKGDFCSCFH